METATSWSEGSLIEPIRQGVKSQLKSHIFCDTILKIFGLTSKDFVISTNLEASGAQGVKKSHFSHIGQYNTFM